MYNPFSVYTVVPWAIVLTLSQGIVAMVLEAIIGYDLDHYLRGVICLIVFIVDLSYMLFVILIHLRHILDSRRTGRREAHQRAGFEAIKLIDLVNILIAAPLIWVWLFLALYYFDHDLYTPVNPEYDQAGSFYNLYLKFFAYALVTLNGGAVTIEPLLTVSELAEGFAALYYQCTSIIVLSSLLNYFSST